MKWEKVKLADVCSTIKTGKTPPTGNAAYFGGEVHWFCPADIGDSQLLYSSSRTITKQAVEENKAVIYEENSILLTCIGEIGRCGILKNKASSNQQITALKFKEFIEPRFAYYWFVYNRKKLQGFANNAVVPILNNQSLKSLDFIYPPLSVQKRLADTLDKADALRQKDQQLLQKYDALAQSIFYDMFGDPVQNERKWNAMLFGELCQSFKYGTNVKSHEHKTLKSVPVIRIPNVLNNSVVFTDLKFSELPEKEWKDVRLEKGDLLFVRTNGNPEYIGRCAVYNSSMESAYASYLIRARLKYDTLLLPQFVQSVLSSEMYRSEVVKRGTTTAGNYNINTESLKSLSIILPPIEQQRQYEEVHKRINIMKEKANLNLKCSNIIFQNLISNFFK